MTVEERETGAIVTTECPLCGVDIDPERYGLAKHIKFGGCSGGGGDEGV